MVLSTPITMSARHSVPSVHHRRESLGSTGTSLGRAGARIPAFCPGPASNRDTVTGAAYCAGSVPGRSVTVDRMAGPALIEARALTKRFGSYVAVDGIDFRVERGQAFGFLGPNGAGKSSTMRMIGCVSPVTSGELRVLDMDPRVDGPAIRARLGSVPQEDNLDTELTVWDNLFIY